MIIRDARTADAPAIAALWNPWIRDTAITFSSETKSPEVIAQMITERQAAGRAFLLAEVGDALLGFASYAQFRTGPGYARSMEHSIILSPDATGQGSGRALMAALETHARAAGHRLMMAAVSAENPRARAFHLALGYSQMGCLPQAGFKFGRHIDLWLLGKLL